eukprot:scaffold162476_cov35-Tisochrysis_lutea.AAC.1
MKWTAVHCRAPLDERFVDGTKGDLAKRADQKRIQIWIVRCKHGTHGRLTRGGRRVPALK